jgi:hypothetical protein
MTKLDKSFVISRNPKDYHKTRHLRRRLKERPVISEEMVEEAIEEGEVTNFSEDEEDERGGDKAIFRNQWLQTNYEVVVNISHGEVKTAYEVES